MVKGRGEGDGEGKSSPFVGGPGPSSSSSHVLSLPRVLVVSSFHVGIALSQPRHRAMLLLLSLSWPRHCCPMSLVCCRAVSDPGGLGRTKGGTYHGALTMTMNDDCWLLFYCHIADGNVAPASCVREDKGGEVSWLTSMCHCLCLFIGAGHCS